MPELPMIGDEFAGFRLRAVLGRGGMSVVYEAENPRLGNVIALKVLAPELANDDIFRTRFLEESRIAASMNHPNVIPIHDMGSSDGLLYIGMRYVSGTDLRQKIRKRGRVQPETAVFLLSQAARALDAAHARGLVHRDVKPGNLLIERGNDDGDPDHLYLSDFGISKRDMTRTGLTPTGQFPGTVDYVAPEQIRGLSVLGTADQYSLGCVLYECLTGQVPFEKDLDAAIIWAHVEELPTQPTLLRPDLPPAVDEVFDRVLAKLPGDRFRSCREFMAAASLALGDLAGAPPFTGLPRTPRPAAPWPDGDDAAYEGRAAATAADHPSPVPGYAAAPVDSGFLEAVLAPGFPAELTHEGERPALPSGATDPADAAPPASGSGGGDAPGREPGHRRIKSRWLGIAAALVLLAGAGGGAYAALSGKPAAQQRGGPSASAVANSQPKRPLTSAAANSQPKPSTLMNVLMNADNSSIATGKLPPSTCKEDSATLVTCTAPAPGVAQATFTTYPSLTKLYAAYEAKVQSLNSGHFQQNVEDCGAIAPSPFGEVGWNHDELHPRNYTVAEAAAGKMPFAKAAGRMACIATTRGSEDIIWTDDIGNMLGVAIGSGPVISVWNWWVPVHHWILFPGTPSMASMNSCSGLMAQATGCTVSPTPESSMPG